MGGSKTITLVAFAKSCKTTKQAVGQMVNKGRLPVNKNGRIDPKDPVCQAYKAKRMVAAKKKAKKEKDKKASDKKKKGDSGEDSGKTNRYSLEMQKLKQQGENLLLKNKQLRGVLANVKFYDQMFHAQLGYAVSSFMTLPDTCVDSLIALAVAKGTDARAEIVSDLTERINEILEDTKDGWERNYDRAEKDLEEIFGNE